MRDEERQARTLPHNLDAERAILGGILIENQTIDDALAVIASPAFFREAHRLIFEAMITLRDRKTPIDLVPLIEHLERNDELQRVGGPAYVAALVDGVPRATNVEFYANIVREKATLRSLIFAANKISSEAYESSDSSDEVLNRAEAAVMAVAKTSIRGDFQPVDDLVRKASHRFMEAHEHPCIVTGISCGIAEIDELTRGFQPGEVTYLAAGTSRGKSALMMQMATNAGRQGVSGIISLEMSADSLVDRAVAQIAGVDAFRMKTGHLTAYEQMRCSRAFDELSSTSLYIDDVIGLTATQMRAKVRRFASRKKLKSLFIDYVQLMHDAGKFSTRNEELASVSRNLKLLAIELQIPIIVLSQLSRAGTKDDDKPPTLADMRDSGALEQDADVVFLLWRHAEHGQTVVDLIIAKQRNGPTAQVRLIWIPEQMRFSSAREQERNEEHQPEMAL